MLSIIHDLCTHHDTQLHVLFNRAESLQNFRVFRVIFLPEIATSQRATALLVWRALFDGNKARKYGNIFAK